MIRHCHPLARDIRGGTIVEFALLAPVFLGLLLGVLQIGLGMQSYNALRGVTADVARNTVVEYQVSNKVSSAQIRQQALATAIAEPYMLQADALRVRVSEPADQRVDGATEFEMAIEYDVPSVTTLMGFAAPTISYTRPIFVLDD